MRLLEKSEIAKAKAVDRSKEISEGLKISKRVDSLRELASREEQTLDMVRTRELERMATDFLAAEKKKPAFRRKFGLVLHTRDPTGRN